MKLIKADKEKYCFQMPEREKQLFVKVVSSYPLVPASHQKLSRNETRPEAEQMLEEALETQRRENRERVHFFLTCNLREHEGHYRITLQQPQMEWMLQVLNDVRVGSWLLLGSPAGPVEIFKALNQATAPHYWTMEMASAFQMIFLRALDGTDAPEAESSADE